MFSFKKESSPYPHQRRHERIVVFIPVKVRLLDRMIVEGQIGDLSIGGAFLILKKGQIQTGDHLSIEFILKGIRSKDGKPLNLEGVDSDSSRFEAEGEVRWGKANSGFGIQFQSLSPQMRNLITRLVKTQKDFENKLHKLSMD